LNAGPTVGASAGSAPRTDIQRRNCPVRDSSVEGGQGAIDDGASLLADVRRGFDHQPRTGAQTQGADSVAVASKHRVLETPARRGKGNKARGADDPPTPAERRATMTWAQRLRGSRNLW
jgi:hypothetical protein